MVRLFELASIARVVGVPLAIAIIPLSDAKTETMALRGFADNFPFRNPVILSGQANRLNALGNADDSWPISRCSDLAIGEVR